MKHYYSSGGSTVEYQLTPDPPEAIYWSTYRLKKSDVTLVQKFDRSTAAAIKQEIFDDIISREPNNRKPATADENPIPERRQVAQPKYVEIRGQQQKTRRKNKSKDVERHAVVQPKSRRKSNLPNNLRAVG